MSQKVIGLLQSKKTLIMGIVNVTPDSFSDGGLFFNLENALQHAERLQAQGADILDVGGESTRPNATEISVQQELDRVIPVIERINQNLDVAVSIDTSKPVVMHAAINAGASMVNDVNALQQQGAVAEVAQQQVSVCLMHRLGTPQNMQQQAHYQDVVAEVISFLRQRIQLCVEAGIKTSNIIVDPGIGFAKTLDHNLQLLNKVSEIKQQLNSPVLIGVSRKSMIDALLGREVAQRLAGSLALAVQAVINGAKIIRVHDVQASYDAIRCVEAVVNKR